MIETSLLVKALDATAPLYAVSDSRGLPALENGDAVAEPEIIELGERTANEEIPEADDRDRAESRTSSATICSAQHGYTRLYSKTLSFHPHLSNFTRFHFHAV